MNKIVFTPWNKVNIISENVRESKTDRVFMNFLYANINSDVYNLTYNPKEYSFTMVLDDEEYQVILPTDVHTSLKTRNYKKLALELLKIAALKKKYNDKIEAKNNREQRIKDIENSGYSRLETIEDYELYLEYLNEKSKTITTDSERELLNAKIRGLLNVLTNPYNLSLHFNRFICEIADKGKELDEDKKAELEVILRDITSDYYKEIVSKSEEMLILGSSDKPMDIIRRIVDAEEKVKTWLTGKVETKPVVKNDEPETVVLDELDEISERLHNIVGGGK